VDDDASVRKALGRLLSACSFEITTFGSAIEFLKSLEQELPHCLVVDLRRRRRTAAF
jgi:FixJ family two-component response regulator